jgi:hypothetical protein
MSSIIVYEAAVALSLDFIYRSLNEFFSNKFAAREGLSKLERYVQSPDDGQQPHNYHTIAKALSNWGYILRSSYLCSALPR